MLGQLDIVILAAGQGKRMASERPKVLHCLGGQPLLAHVLDTAAALQPRRRVVVYGHGGEQVRAAFDVSEDISWVEQTPQLGTGHAVAQALPHCSQNSVILVLYGDVPLLGAETLIPLLEAAEQGSLALLTTVLDNPHGYGRIVRGTDGSVLRIVEHKDAMPEELALDEVNTGIMALPGRHLSNWLNRLDNGNVQGEYYLTDVVALAVADDISVAAVQTADTDAVEGVNDRIQLARLERRLQQRRAEQLMLAGATLIDPARIDIRGSVTTGKDVLIDVNVVFEGQVTLGDRVRIGPHCVIRDSYIGSDCVIHPHTVLEQSQLAKAVQVGPFARLRPGTRLADRVKIGNFVETKNTVLGEGSKANHLSYLGDSEVGRNVNVGAGTITVNYDGANKHRTLIGDEVFIGSNSALVAPISIGNKATVGAGSTLRKDVPADTLTVTRSPLRQIKGWRRPRKS